MVVETHTSVATLSYLHHDCNVAQWLALCVGRPEGHHGLGCREAHRQEEEDLLVAGALQDVTNLLPASQWRAGQRHKVGIVQCSQEQAHGKANRLYRVAMLNALAVWPNPIVLRVVEQRQ